MLRSGGCRLMCAARPLLCLSTRRLLEGPGTNRKKNVMQAIQKRFGAIQSLLCGPVEQQQKRRNYGKKRATTETERAPITLDFENRSRYSVLEKVNLRC